MSDLEGLRYTVPPVIEAIVQFVYAEPLDDSTYSKLTRRLARHYVNSLEQKSVNAQVDLVKQATTFTTTPQHRLSSGDETNTLVVAPGSLTWSRLAPYDGWANLIKRVSDETESAHSGIGYRKVSRLGVRYINRIDVPEGPDQTRYEDYLAINIALPDKWPMVNNYGWRFEREFGEYLGIVQSAVVEPEIPGKGSFLLDIDIILQGELPARRDDLLEKLGAMRHLKNDIFETSITDTARASFQR